MAQTKGVPTEPRLTTLPVVTSAVQVKSPADGTVLVVGSKTVMKAREQVKGKVPLNLPVKPKAKAIKALKRKGKFTVKLVKSVKK